MNGEASNVRVPGPDQVLGTTEILSGVRVLGVPDHQTPRLRLPDSLGRGWVQAGPVLEPSGLGLGVTSRGQTLQDGHFSLGNLRTHRHHSEIFL